MTFLYFTCYIFLDLAYKEQTKIQFTKLKLSVEARRSMSIEWFRDLIIIIVGIMTIGVIVFFMILFYSIYRRLKRTLDSISHMVDEVVKPIIRITTIFGGVHQGIDIITKILRYFREGGNDEQG